MCGARPAYVSLALIIEEGFPVRDLIQIVNSMQETAHDANVQIVTGDTKVVERGSGDGIFINTSGIGVLDTVCTPSPDRICPDDVIILSGDVGRHGVAIMAARESLELDTAIESDTAALCRPVQALLNCGVDVHCLRDLTRGGLATALVELAQSSGNEFRIHETKIPITETVRAVCEILGLDPFYVANEGRFIAFVPEQDADRALSVLEESPLCPNPQVIGAVQEADRGAVTCKTTIGALRAIDMLSGEQLPRIC
jgi:hydrogenase expression/formation protein HypE